LNKQVVQILLDIRINNSAPKPYIYLDYRYHRFPYKIRKLCVGNR